MSGEPEVIAEAWGHRVFDNGLYVTTETYALWFPGTVTALLADLAKRLREDVETLESFRKEDTESVVGLANEHVRLKGRIEAIELQMRARVNGANINHGRVQDLINRVAALEARLSTVPLPAPVWARMLQDETALNRLRGWIHDEVSRILETRQQDGAGEGAGAEPDYHEDAPGAYVTGRATDEVRRETSREIAEGMRKECDESEVAVRHVAYWIDWIEREFGWGADPEPVPHSEDATRAFFIDLAKVIDPAQTIPPSVRTTVRREHSDGRPCTQADEVPRVVRSYNGDWFYGSEPIRLSSCDKAVDVCSSRTRFDWIPPRHEVWIRVSADGQPNYESEISLNHAEASALRDRLQAWLDDHQEGVANG